MFEEINIRFKSNFLITKLPFEGLLIKCLKESLECVLGGGDK